MSAGAIQPIEGGREMVGGMNPDLKPGRFVFVSLPEGASLAALIPDSLAMFREAEGVSLLMAEEQAIRHGLEASAPMAQITLNVYSSLTGVGLTAAVATALAEAGIACNMIAATLHDHAFVPADRADEAVQILRRLQQAVQAG